MKIRAIALSDLTVDARAKLCHRGALPDRALRARAAEIVASVRVGGDHALAEAGSRYGGSNREGPMLVPRARIAAAAKSLDPTVRDALTASREAIRSAHEVQVPRDVSVETTPGVIVQRSWTPLRRIGAYVPGGGGAYPSSLLMSVVPARVAGVAEIVVATPADQNGSIPDVVLAAADLVDVDEIYAMGGAQAIAALAYGTGSIPRVEKIVGPGNAWVTAAKLEVFGDVAVDLPAGPSEALILWDGTVPANIVAADILCQAEHGPDSPVIVVTTAAEQLSRVFDAIDGYLSTLDREQVIRKALGDHGLIITTLDLDAAISFANSYAAEHVSILTASAAPDATLITGAGSVFVGEWAPESAGDYATGANHILPTGGLARSHSPLGVDDFVSWRQIQYLTRDGLSRLRSTIGTVAGAEGFTAHRLAVEARFAEMAAG